MNYKFVGVLALLVLGAGLVLSQGFGPSSSGGVENASAGQAELTSSVDPAVPNAETSDPDAWKEKWSAQPEAQAAIDEINDLLISKFGSYGQWTDNGLIGMDLDDAKEQVSISGDASRIDLQLLEKQLRAVVEGRIDVIVKPSTNSAADLVKTGDELLKIGNSDSPPGTAFSFGVDAKSSTYEVTVGPEGEQFANDLKSKFGDLVTIIYGSPSRLSREDDEQPHRGGAAIRRVSVANNYCSSGFTVRIQSTDTLGSVSAGHCFANEQRIWSGSFFYGEAWGEQNYPTFDMIRIHPAGQNFAKKIYTNPGDPNLRDIVDYGNPSLGDFVCVSGAWTKAKCGLEVFNMTDTYCDVDGCTPNLFRSGIPGDVVSQGGDSGGPVYNRYGSDSAAIRGMIVARTLPQNVLSHKISTINSHLGVYPAMVP